MKRESSFQKYLISYYTLLALIFPLFAYSQCGNSFGEPVFLEDFGVRNGSDIYAGPLSGNATTTYDYVATNNVQDGDYTITFNANNGLGSFVNMEDFTDDANGEQGNMLLVNADFSPGEFYRRRVSNLCNSGNTYRFSAYLLNVLSNGVCNPEQPVNVLFEVYLTNGTLLGSTNTGNIFTSNNPQWHEFTFDFNLPSGITELDVVLVNNAPGGCGNDLAIDNINFQICGEDLGINSDYDIFNEINCNPETTTLTADLGSNVVLNPTFEWQISNDNGTTWINFGTNSNITNLNASDYNDGDLVRFSVISSSDTNSLCKLFSNEFLIELAEFNVNDFQSIIRYSETNQALFDLTEINTELENQFDINDLDINFFEDINLTIPINNPQSFLSEETTVYVSIEHNTLNCDIEIKPLMLEILPPLEFPAICDNDRDGITTIPYTELIQFIRENIVNQNNELPRIFMARASNGIVELVDPEGNQEYNVLCSSLPGVNGYFELAVNNRQELFLATDDQRLLNVDTENCTFTEVNGSFSTNIAMSFDSQNNLYSGSLNSSRVFVSRENNNYSTIDTWHNFQDGNPAGDFIELNGKLYISWSLNGDDLLYEVTIDNNFNYVSHVVLGQILNRTFGMAGEQGTLYGVRTGQVYRIDLNSFNTTVIFNNPDSGNGNRWFGAAGLHEAQQLTRLYHTENDALNQTNPITQDFENQIPFTDVVYYRIDIEGSPNPIIIPIRLTVNPIPESPNLDPTYTSCMVPIELDATVSGNVSYQWFLNDESLNETTPIITATQSGTYRVLITDNDTLCFTESSTEVTIINPQITAIEIENNIVTVTAVGGDNLEYSSDGITWQSSNVFRLENGEYNLFVRKGTCVSNPYPITIFFISNIFTPNGDGINDTWYITNIQNYPSAVVTVYDRYGKQLFTTNAQELKPWDGTYLRNKLPSGSYWYILTIENQTYKGSVTIKY